MMHGSTNIKTIDTFTVMFCSI